jgi:choline kinase
MTRTMKLIVPAAGVGVRFAGTAGPLPKCLIPISGRPIISYLLRMASASSIISQIIIILGPYYDAVQETIQDLASSIRWKSATEILCVKNPDFAKTNSIYSIYLARDFLEGNFLVQDSDVLVAPQLFVNLAAKKGRNIAWALAERMQSIPEEETKVVTDQNDQVIQFGETEISSEIAHGRFIGLSNFRSGASEVFRDEVISLVKAGMIGTYYTMAMKALSTRKMLHTLWTNGQPWFEIDTLDDLKSIDPNAKEAIIRQISPSKNEKMKATVKSLGDQARLSRHC